MKKLLTLLLILTAGIARAQQSPPPTLTPRSPISVAPSDAHIDMKDGKMPVFPDTATALAHAFRDSIGLFFKERNTSNIWIRDSNLVAGGHKWTLVGSGGGDGGVTTASGDASGTASGTNLPLTLATVNSNVGSFGSATQIPLITINAKGLATAAANVSIQIAESQVINLSTDLAGKQASGSYITALTGDVTAAGPGSAAATIANNAVTNAKAAQVPANSMKGNNTGSTANQIDLTTAQIISMLQAITDNTGSIQFVKYGLYANRPTSGQGLYFASDSAQTGGWFYVNGSTATNITPQISLTVLGNTQSGGDTTMVTLSGNIVTGFHLNVAGIRDSAGSCVHHIVNADHSWTFYSTCTVLNGNGYVKMAGTTPAYQSNTQLTADVNTFTTSLSGSVPAPGSSTGKVLSDAGTWVTNGSSGSTPNLQAVTTADSITSTGIYSAHLNANAPIFYADTVCIRGDSRAVPAGLTGTNLANGWPLSLGHDLSKYIDDEAIGGTIISDTTISGAASFYLNIPTLMPHASTHKKVLIWMYGRNDQTYGCSTPLFALTQRMCIDSATMDYGFSASNIYVVFGDNPGETATITKAYHDSLVTICAQKGVNFVDVYTQEQRYKLLATTLFVDGIHENTVGNNLIFSTLINAYKSPYDVLDSNNSQNVVGDVVDAKRIRFRVGDAYPDTSYNDKSNVDWVGVDKDGNLVRMSNATLPYSNPSDSLGVPYNLNISGNVKGAEGVFGGSYFGNINNGVTKAFQGVYIGQLNGNGYGYIAADNGQNSNNKPMFIGNAQPLIIGNYSFTPNADMLNVCAGGADILGALSVGSNTPATSKVQVTVNTMTVPTASRWQGDVFGTIIGTAIDGSSGSSTSIPWVTTYRFPGLPYTSSGTGITYTKAATVVISKPIAVSGITIAQAYAQVDSGKVLITDSLQLSNLGNKSGDTTNFKPLVADANGNFFKGSWYTGSTSAIPSQFSQTASGTTLTNSTTQASILGTGTGSLTISANSLSVGQKIILRGYGVYSAAIGSSGNIGLTPMVAGTGIIGWAIAGPTSTAAVSVPFQYTEEITVVSTGSSGSGFMMLKLELGNGEVFMVDAGSFTLNTTASIALDLQAQWNSASSSNSIQTLPSFTVNIQ